MKCISHHFQSAFIEANKTIVFGRWKSDFNAKSIKDTHRVKVHSNKTPTLMKSMNMDIWVVGTSNQLFMRGC